MSLSFSQYRNHTLLLLIINQLVIDPSKQTEVKVTPVNFASYIESDLINFWKDRVDAKDGVLEATRSHNFKISKTALSVIQTSGDRVKTHCLIDLVDIPQKEDYPALNCLLHVPNMSAPKQLLMIFKQGEEASFWTRKILKSLENLLANVVVEQDTVEVEDDAEEDTESPVERSETEI